MSSKNRKVYQMGDMSMLEFFRYPVRYLRESIQKESVFEKPYLDEDRGRMHADIPDPDWPSMPPGEAPPEGGGPIPGLPGCAIVCYEPLDCDEPIWCHPGIWCGTDLGCTLCSWEVEGATTGYTEHLTGIGSWGIDVWIDTNLVESGGEALIRICMTDPCGNVCCHDSEVVCKVCPPEIVISWDDDLSADTIAQGNGGLESATITVKNGQGDYNWEVTGTGFSLLHNTTVGVGNTLQADDTACGTATITVTDFCGDTATGYVRCTAGEWSLLFLCSACSATDQVCSAIGKTECDPPVDLTVGKYKWTYGYPTGYEYWNSDEDCPPEWYLGDVDVCMNHNYCAPPPCGTPTECGSGTPSSGRTCYAIRYWKWEWVCV